MARKPILGLDYDLERWSDGTRDNEGKLVWHKVENEGYPSNAQTPDIRLVTLDLNPDGEPDYRNYPISPHRPLDVYGTDDEFSYDLDDIAERAFLDYGFEF